jgi:hypothetical protein
MRISKGADPLGVMAIREKENKRAKKICYPKGKETKIRRVKLPTTKRGRKKIGEKDAIQSEKKINKGIT